MEPLHDYCTSLVLPRALAWQTDQQQRDEPHPISVKKLALGWPN